MRGHEATLCEKDNTLGGQLILAAKPPYKEEITDLIKYLSCQVKKLGVKIKLGTEVTLNKVKKIKPDVVIIATGATPIIPEIPGVDRPNVITACRFQKKIVFFWFKSTMYRALCNLSLPFFKARS